MSEFLQDNVSIRIELAQELADFFAEVFKRHRRFLIFINFTFDFILDKKKWC